MRDGKSHRVGLVWLGKDWEVGEGRREVGWEVGEGWDGEVRAGTACHLETDSHI